MYVCASKFITIAPSIQASPLWFACVIIRVLLHSALCQGNGVMSVYQFISLHCATAQE